MKLQILFFSSFFFLSLVNRSNGQISESTCPEVNSTSIFILHGVLTNPELHSDRQPLDLNYDIETDNEILQKGSDLDEYLRIFWKDNGVRKVADTEICRNITEALKEDSAHAAHLVKFHHSYYKANGTYIVIYNFNRFSTGTGRLPPHPVLDQNFKIIGELSLRLKN